MGWVKLDEFVFDLDDWGVDGFGFMGCIIDYKGFGFGFEDVFVFVFIVVF